MNRYQDDYRRSLDDPNAFWMHQAARIPWFRPPTQALTTGDGGHARWFADGELNLCHAALDHHVDQGRGDQVAIYWDSPVTRGKRQLTYREMRDQVALCAGALQKLGVTQGDRVVIYMPMVPEALIAMYACARLGAIHSVVFGGFSSRELALRIDDARPKLVISASCGVEVDRVVPYQPIVADALRHSAHAPSGCLYLQRDAVRAELGPGDHDWEESMASARPVDCVAVAATDPLYILYTSGTTGKPKGVVRDTGGYAVALHYSMEAIYAMAPGEVFFSASDVGWVVGHSYIVYAPLLAGCSSVVYEGKPVRTPDAGAFWRLISEYNVKSFFTAPTAFRAVRKEDPDARLLAEYDITSLRSLFLAGERLDPPTYHWLKSHLQVPVIDHWWQTETGWPIAANPLGLTPMPTKAGSATMPVPGYDVRILDRRGEEVPALTHGSVVIKHPLPPGCLSGIWGDPERMAQAYMKAHPGYYLSGDSGYFDEDGYLFVMGRTDDVINVAGHRLSTGEMEEVLGSHPAVAECAVIGTQDPLKGQLPLGMVIPRADFEGDTTTLEQELVALVRERIGPVACFKQVLVVERLPKTRSGKILRKALRHIADGEAFDTPSTIDDPTSLEDARQAIEALRPSDDDAAAASPPRQ
ncbi:propionyl-CoA synthetase [Salinicola sp. MIT1003]|uniref:propionyl-CoA synthetase n=1 Tax=Salinicola sp. MIT1003 TaxID=1882734 RepID=UPI0008DC6E7F|nr:propionyl-CoA synthetase [Salinicola sp. MIT1003]OHZ02791.1 propionyl-CoA synthetase [Salinicola sp. MIT1003]